MVTLKKSAENLRNLTEKISMADGNGSGPISWFKRRASKNIISILYRPGNKLKMHIRTATPEDAKLLAKSILIAGRAHVRKGIWEIVIGGTEEECLNFLYHIAITKVPHLFHYSQYLIAEEQGGFQVGSLGGYDPGTHGYEALSQAIPEVIQKLKLDADFAKASDESAAKSLACVPKGIEGAWVIDSVATFPVYRQKGVAETLLREIMNKGKILGHSLAQVSMYIGNEPA